MMKRIALITIALVSAISLYGQTARPESGSFQLTPGGYFRQEGVDVMAFSDFYPEGHQSGIVIIMNGNRVASNGDLRFEPTPGQWQPVPRKISRQADGNAIVTQMAWPDSTLNSSRAHFYLTSGRSSFQDHN